MNNANDGGSFSSSMPQLQKLPARHAVMRNLRSSEALRVRHRESVDAQSSMSAFQMHQRGRSPDILHYTDALVEDVDPALRARFEQSRQPHSAARRRKKKKQKQQQQEEENDQESVDPDDPRTYFSVAKTGELETSETKRKSVEQRREEAKERRRKIHNARFARVSTAEGRAREPQFLDCGRCGGSFPVKDVDRNALECRQHLAWGQQETDAIGRVFCMNCETWFHPNYPYDNGCLPIRHKFPAPTQPVEEFKPFVVRHEERKVRHVNRNMNLHCSSSAWKASTRPTIVLRPDSANDCSESSDPDEDVRHYQRSAYSTVNLQFKPRDEHVTDGVNSIGGTGSYTDKDHERKPQFDLTQADAVPKMKKIATKVLHVRNESFEMQRTSLECARTVLALHHEHDDSDDMAINIVHNIAEPKMQVQQRELRQQQPAKLKKKKKKNLAEKKSETTEYIARTHGPPTRYASLSLFDQPFAAQVDRAVVNQERSILAKVKATRSDPTTQHHARVAMDGAHKSQTATVTAGVVETDIHGAPAPQDIVILSPPLLNGRRKKKPVHRGDVPRRLHPSVLYRLDKYKEHLQQEQSALERRKQHAEDGLVDASDGSMDSRRDQVNYQVENWKRQKVSRVMRTMRRDPSFKRIEQVPVQSIIVQH